MRLLSEATETVLLQARLPEGTTTLQVPDDHACFNDEQKVITTLGKTLFNVIAATSTFKLVEKNGERNIYEPSVMNKDGVISVQWGDQFVPVDRKVVIFDGYANTVTVEDEGGVEVVLKVRTLNIKPEDAKTDVQKAYAKLAKDDRGAFLNKAWKSGTIVELLASGYPTVLKLSDLEPGVYAVTEYKMGSFDKYILLTEKGWVRANTSLQNKLADYDDMSVQVNEERPAQLTVEPSTAKTSKGYDIIPVRLTSFANVSLPVFDFSSL